MIADIRGRIGTLRFSVFLSLYFRLFTIALSTDSFWQQFGSKFIIQFSCGGSLIVSFLCLVETLPSYTRQKLMLMSITLGILMGNLVVYAVVCVDNVYMKKMLLLLPAALLLIIAYVMGETICYLKTSGDFDSVINNLMEIAKANKQKLPRKLNLKFKNCRFGSLESLFIKKGEYTLVLILLLAIILTNTIVTYQIYFNSLLPNYNLFRLDDATPLQDCSKKTTLEQYPSYFLPLAVWRTVFLFLATGFLTAFKKPLLLLVIIQGSITVLSTLFLIIPQNETDQITLYITCKLTFVSPWILLSYVSELYQTNYRGIGLGFINFAGVLVAIIMMFIVWSWAEVGYKVSMIVLAFLSAFSCVLVYLCPTKSTYK